MQNSYEIYQPKTMRNLIEDIAFTYEHKHNQKIDFWALFQATQKILQQELEGEDTPYLVGPSKLISFDSIVDPEHEDGLDLIILVFDKLDAIHFEAKRLALANKSNAAEDIIKMKNHCEQTYGQSHDTIMDNGVNKWIHEAQKIRAEIETKFTETKD